MSASRTSTTLASAARSSSALAAARSSAVMQRVDSEFQSQLAYKSCPAALYGIALLFMGLGLLGAGLRSPAVQSAMLLEVSGGIAAIGALALLLLQLGVTIDRKLRRIVKWRWFGMQRPCAVHNLSAFDFLTIAQAGRGSRTRFEICMSDSSTNFSVASFPTEVEAHDFAHEVGRFLNVRVVDSVSGEWNSVR